jgi:hypothetical protein
LIESFRTNMKWTRLFGPVAVLGSGIVCDVVGLSESYGVARSWVFPQENSELQYLVVKSYSTSDCTDAVLSATSTALNMCFVPSTTTSTIQSAMLNVSATSGSSANLLYVTYATSDCSGVPLSSTSVETITYGCSSMSYSEISDRLYEPFVVGALAE